MRPHHGVIISRDRRKQNNCSGEKEEWRRIRIQLLDLDHLRFGSTGLGLSVMRGARLRNRYQLAPNADRFAADARVEATEGVRRITSETPRGMIDAF
ncbi:hypothetical protein SAY87_001904 [Trapa incisa]|uniref:Uncharacterized protein n=1 Tax=Trapa incisa TaxID=236973 RepID=A0AAN7PYA9_9MYRT|nr:hypothetical protein SAY87_001904 [Trapa incisa]